MPSLPRHIAVSGSKDCTLKVWDLVTGQCLRTLQGHEKSVEAVAADPARRRAVSGDADGKLKVWDLASGQCLQTFHHGGSVAAVAADFMQGRALTGSSDETLTLWDLATGQSLLTLRGHDRAVSAVAADFTQHRAVSCSADGDGMLRLWDLATGQCLRTLEGHSSGVMAVAADFTRLRAVSGSCDLTLKVWNLTTGQCLQTLDGHVDWVWAVAVDFARRRAVSASCDKTLKVWDLSTGKCLRTLEGHKDPVVAVAADFTQHRAVSGSWDGTLKVWDLGTGQCLRTLEGHHDMVIAVSLCPGDRFVEPFEFDCLTGAEMSWQPRHFVNLAPSEKREYTEEVTSKAAEAVTVWSSAGSRSQRELHRAAVEGLQGLLARDGAGAALVPLALAPLCAGLGPEAVKLLTKLFAVEHMEQTTESQEEGYKFTCRSVTGQSKRCTHSLQAAEKPLNYQAWQRQVRLTYTHQQRSVSIDLELPGVVLVPIGQTPGEEYGTLPKAPASGGYSKSDIYTISAIIRGGCL